MSETGEGPIYPTSSIPKDSREAEMSSVTRRIKYEQGEDYLFLSDIAKPKEYDRAMDIGAAASIDIQNIHEKAGIPLSQEQLPFVFVVPEEKWDETMDHFGHKGQSTAGFVTDDGQVVAVKEEKDTLLLAQTIHHEMMHAVGREATVVGDTYYGKRVQGYRTNGEEYSSARGQALEEGVAQYFALEFVVNSDLPDIEKAREDTLQYWTGDVSALNNDARDYTIQLHVLANTPRKYIFAERMVRDLIYEGGPDMRSTLLKARVDTKQRGALVNKINETYGNKEAARKIFQTQFDDESMNETLTWLREQRAINKQPDAVVDPASTT